MEQWQFLIQKQGDRTWQSLESPYVEIMEGRYRVVARSNNANTDVEVRVTHLSPDSLPPRRRIHKRSRRTNAEGLMAVIPFTYFEKGVWEVRCSGDLMSDMLGRSWQQILHLQVLADATHVAPQSNDMGGDEVEEVGSMSSIFKALSKADVSNTDVSETPTSSSPSPEIAVASSLPVPPIPPNFTEIPLKTDGNNLPEDSSLNINTEASHSFAFLPTVESKLSTASANDFTIAQTFPNQEQIIQRIVIDSDSDITIADAGTEVNISESLTTTHDDVLEDTTENTNSPTRNLQEEEVTILSGVTAKPNEPIEAELSPATSTLYTEIISGDATETKPNEPNSAIALVKGNEISDIDNIDIADIAIDEPANLIISNVTEQIRQNDREEAIIHQLTSPVWVKGDTAEQILHNLIELALPPSQPLLAESVNQLLLDNVPLPLLLTLDEQAYVARWGRPLTICGRAQLIPTDNPSDDASEFESVLKGELRIELLEPQGLEVLIQAQQSLREKLLPFGFEFTIDIPANSQSKLLLADVSLYGSLSGVEDPVLLATQSFIITADVTELLAAGATARPSEPDMLDYPLAALTPEPEPTVALNLELFNLVKAAKQTQPQALQLSPKRALPLQIEPRKSQPINAYSQISTSTLPFLKKRPIPLIEEVSSSTIGDGLEDLEIAYTLQTITDFETHTPTEVPELLIALDIHQDTETPNGDITFDSEVASETDTAMLNPFVDVTSDKLPQTMGTLRSQLLGANRSQMSPLIQKWIQSQGYSLSETINLQYSSLDIPNSDISNTVNTEGQESLSSENSDLPIDSENSTVIQDSGPTSESPVDESLQLPNRHNPKTPAWLAQEIVIDDTFDYNSISTPSAISSQPEAPKVINNLFNSLPLVAENTKQLPIPKLILPTSDLISGKTIRVRILLPEMEYSSRTLPASPIAIKLWVEDCQTRWLLEGPHLLTNLLPSTRGKGSEAVAELNVPFGCLEIRIEAIAFDMATQQESHKVSIQRTVIPPDLPTLQHDELLGI